MERCENRYDLMMQLSSDVNQRDTKYASEIDRYYRGNTTDIFNHVYLIASTSIHFNSVFPLQKYQASVVFKL